MITNIQLYSDPYQKEVFNILYHQVGNGQIQEHLEDRLSRLRKMPLKDSLFPNDFLGWKGLFAELYDSLRVKQASLTFYGTTQDYEMILNAYKEYENVSKNRKIEITFCIKNSKIAEDCEPKNRYEAFKNLKKIYEELNFTTDITRGLSKFWSEVSCIELEDKVILIESEITNFFEEDKIKKFQERLNLKKQSLEELEKLSLGENSIYIITLSQQFLIDAIYKKKMLKIFETIAYHSNISIFVVCYDIQEKEKQKIRTELKNFLNLTMVWENKEDFIWLDFFYKELENQVILRKIGKIVQIYRENEAIFLELKDSNFIINKFFEYDMKVMQQMCDFSTLFIKENNILKKEKDFMEKFLQEVDDINVPNIFKTCIGGIDGGWVEEVKAVVQFERFSHNVMVNITEKFHQLYDSISKMDESIIQDYISIFSMGISQELGCFIECNSYNEYSKNIIEYLQSIAYKIEPKHIVAKPLQNKYWNTGIASEEVDYIDLLQWETSLLMALRKEIAIIIEYWKQEKRNHQENKKKKMIKLVEEFIWKTEQQLIKLYLQYFIEQMECLGTITKPNEDFSKLFEIQRTIALSKEELRKIENLPLYE